MVAVRPRPEEEGDSTLSRDLHKLSIYELAGCRRIMHSDGTSRCEIMDPDLRRMEAQYAGVAVTSVRRARGYSPLLMT